MKTALKTKYLGGHPARSKPTAATLTVTDDGVSAKILRPFLDVPWSEVTHLAVEGPEQVEKRVTATRLLALGVFAFAAKKKQKTAYVTVGTVEGEAIFEVDTTPQELRAKLAWALKG